MNDYEQILTHRTGSVVKDITLAVMLTGFVCWLYLPAGAVVALSFALIVPAMALSWHQVRRYGTRKSDICAANTSRTVEHVTGMQTLRAYGIGGVKNEAIVDSMREYSDVSFWYEAASSPSARSCPSSWGCASRCCSSCAARRTSTGRWARFRTC